MKTKRSMSGRFILWSFTSVLTTRLTFDRAALAAFALAACATAQTPSPRAETPPAKPVEVREGSWPIRDTRIFVRDVGPENAATIVVLHGGPGGNHLSLRPLEALAPQYRVVFYDQRGCGESDRLTIEPQSATALDALSVQQNVEDLEALRVRLGPERITLLGHSWGGALAVFYAAAYPQHVEKLVVYSGGPEDAELQKRKSKAHFAKLSDEEKALVKARMKALQTAAESGAPQDDLDRLFFDVAGVMFPSLYCKRPTAASAEQGRAGFWANRGIGPYSDTFDRTPFAAKVKTISAPALLSWGRCEPSPQERLLYLLDHLPNAQFVVFEHSGHNAMEEEPDLYFKVLRAFLQGATLPNRPFRTRAEVPASP